MEEVATRNSTTCTTVVEQIVPGSETFGQNELTEDHIKLLYLISCYSRNGKCWIRKVHLLVLIYEGIVSGAFDYDYAPFSDIVASRRIYLNISQEGRDDIDDLREANCIYGFESLFFAFN
jgi:hypothetical protein